MSTATDIENLHMEDLMIKGISSLWEEGHFLDYTIEVEGRRFKVHKAALATKSGYFHDLFTETKPENQQNSVAFQNLTAVAMENLIQYIYTNKMKMTLENATEILQGASFLQIPSVIEEYVQFITDNLSLDTCFDALSILKMLNHMEGLKKIHRYMDLNMLEIIQGCCFGQLTLDDIYFFISNWQSPEWELFMFINNWVNAHSDQQHRHLDDLLARVRYCLMTRNQLKALKNTAVYKDSTSPWKALVGKALQYHKLPTNRKVLQVSNQTQARGKITIALFTKDPENQPGSYFDVLHNTDFVEHPSLQMPQGTRQVYAAVSLNDFHVVCVRIYFGGNMAQSSDQQWYIFDVRTMQWSRMGNHPRSFYSGAMAHNNTCIFTVGGASSYNWNSPASCSIEKYNFLSNKWTCFAKLRLALKDQSVCISNGKLYVSGGLPDGRPPQATMNCLTLSTKNLKSKAPMLEPRCGHSMNVMQIHGEKVITILDDALRMEYYTPGSNQWSKCAFVFTAPYPTRNEVGEVLYNGNRVFLLDVDLQEALGEAGMQVAILDFPKDGRKVKMATHCYAMQVGDRGDIHTTLLKTLPLPYLRDIQ